MKNVILLFTCMVIMFTGCVKKKNCDCGINGVWQYLEEPYYINKTNCSNKKHKIVAHFYPDIDNKENDTNYWTFSGNIPAAFKSTTPTYISICYEDYCEGKMQNHDAGLPSVYNLQCIERVK
ncbi:MAG: hypothetical protein LBP67_06090 [Bacteroidales bacterium]|jgi:hypothetical protein|nr:hypothetical protein [Bacteroidales bacterium]